VQVSRRAVGIILLVVGGALTALYFVLLGTYVGPIGELAGAGFCFIFMGLLTTLGELLGLAPEEE
jgi:hypothetical protein